MDMMQILEMLKKQVGQNNPMLPSNNPLDPNSNPLSKGGWLDSFPSPAQQPAPAPSNGLPPRNRSDLARAPAESVAPPMPSLEEVTVPQRNKQLPFLDIKAGSEYSSPLEDEITTPDREKKSGIVEKPFYKDKDRMAMMMAALSDGFGGMTLRGKTGMGTMNKLTMANAQRNMKNNKTMDYMVQNNPEMAKKLMQLPPEVRDKYMGAMVEASFTPAKESVFAEKVRVLEGAGVPREEAISQVLSGSGTNITLNTGNGAKPFEEALGTKTAEWISGRRISSGQNRAEAGRVIDTLEQAVAKGENVTGDWSSYLPESARNLFNPEGVELQQDVERIVQQSLKETLGAQFAQREAEQLFARTWNPKASPEVNLRRTRRLLNELDAYAGNMDALSSGMISSGGKIMQFLQQSPELAGAYTADTIYGIEYEDDFDTAGVSTQQPESDSSAPPAGIPPEVLAEMTEEERALF